VGDPGDVTVFEHHSSRDIFGRSLLSFLAWKNHPFKFPISFADVDPEGYFKYLF
jgi:hypothetical protein